MRPAKDRILKSFHNTHHITRKVYLNFCQKGYIAQLGENGSLA
jgi:hypothetical protein